jgi:hypothetical protein
VAESLTGTERINKPNTFRGVIVFIWMGLLCAIRVSILSFFFSRCPFPSFYYVHAVSSFLSFTGR